MADRSPLQNLSDMMALEDIHDVGNGKTPKSDISKAAGFPMTPPGTNPTKLVGGVRDVPKMAMKPLPKPPADMPDPKKMMAKGD